MSVDKTKARFKVGDTVHWTSSSAGSTKRKNGVVEEVVFAKTLPLSAGNGLASYGQPRDHVSYVVRVGATETRRGQLYWPRAAALQKS